MADTSHESGTRPTSDRASREASTTEGTSQQAKTPQRREVEMNEYCECGDEYDGYNIEPMQASDGHNYPCCTECGEWIDPEEVME